MCKLHFELKLHLKDNSPKMARLKIEIDKGLLRMYACVCVYITDSVVGRASVLEHESFWKVFRHFPFRIE
jgi:hypothetical protein